MNKQDKLHVKYDDSGKLEHIWAELTLYSRKSDKDGYVFYVPSLEYWFQTKTDDDQNLQERIVRHVLKWNFDNFGLQGFIDRISRKRDIKKIDTNKREINYIIPGLESKYHKQFDFKQLTSFFDFIS